MFRNLQVKQERIKYAPDDKGINFEHLDDDARLPLTLHQLSYLPENAKKRMCRLLLPASLLSRFGIDPITWLKEGVCLVDLISEAGSSRARIRVLSAVDDPHPFIQIELSDNAHNGVDLDYLVLNDPSSPYFPIDRDGSGNPTQLGTLQRNLEAENHAMRAGLAPAQTRSSLGASRLVLNNFEQFLTLLGHRACFLEPLTYASAWIFERRGFAYVRGHRLMDDIHREFQPGGLLHKALDGSSPFRQKDAWETVRGRAWAIHDGILAQIGSQWNGLRMVKQIGRHAGVETFPEAIY